MILSHVNLSIARFLGDRIQMTGDVYLFEGEQTYRVTTDLAVSIDSLQTDGQGELRALLDVFESMTSDKIHMSAFRGQPPVLHL